MPRGSRFSALLARFAKQYRQNGGKLTTVAGVLSIQPSLLSRWISGEREPGDRSEVLKLGTALELERSESNELLDARGYAATTTYELAMNEAGEALTKGIHDAILAATEKYLVYPDRDELEGLMLEDAGRLTETWVAYLKGREHLYYRRWPEVKTEVKHGLTDGYDLLRESMGRQYAYLALLKAAADIHQGNLEEAMQAANEALAAISPVRATDVYQLKARIYVRLGDICKFSGRFRAGGRHYKKALETLDEENHKKDAEQAGGVTVEKHRRWRAHWRNRISRKRASLALLQGRGEEALSLLKEPLKYFASQTMEYEEARVEYSRGWGLSLLGKWDEAVRAHERGLQLTEQLGGRRNWIDPMQELEGHLCLANDYLHMRLYPEAEAELEVARTIFDRIRRETHDEADLPGRHRQYNGFYYLLRGRLHRDAGDLDAFEEAATEFTNGINYAKRRAATILPV